MGPADHDMSKRLIIFIDGSPSSAANHTNIQQIYLSTLIGKHIDRTHGNAFKQEIKYVPAIGGADDAFSADRIQASVLRQGYMKQIQDVYEQCCMQTGGNDEVWLFGFSRGAFVARAVAGLLHNFGALASAGYPEFSRDFKKVLKEADTDASSNLMSPVVSLASPLNRKTPPRIQFLGVFDTIKALSDSSSLDISFNRSIRHLRHAVALHEDRKGLKPEYFQPEEMYGLSLKSHGRSFIEAHFVGVHADMGGSAKKSGLALYPLQWMLLEAVECGLAIHPADSPKYPLGMVLPKTPEQGGKELWTFTAANGITTKMQDIREVHGLTRSNEKKYAIKLNSSRMGSIRQRKPRDPFTKEGSLRGYCEWAPQGTIIHPSVYLLLDQHINVVLETKEVRLQRHVEQWRDKMLGAEGGADNVDFCEDDIEESAENPGAIRVLVCGNTGVGKSTLINKTFGVDVTKSSARTRGVHNVREEITWEGRPDLIVHDSGGFEAGADDEFQEIEAFLKEKSEEQNILARVHIIWFCIDINSSRTLQTATGKLFKAVSQYANDAPIVIVATKKDEFLDIEFGACRKMQKKEGKKFDVENCEEYAEQQLQERLDIIRSEMETVEGGRMDACVAVSQDDDESIAFLSKETSRCFDTDKVCLLYIRAQVTRIDLKIDLALTTLMRRYRHLIRRAGVNFAFGGPTIQRKLSTHLMIKAIINCFGLPTVSADVAMQSLKSNVWSTFGSNTQLVLAEAFSIIGVAGTVLAMGAPIWLATGSINTTHIMPTTCRLFLIMACDLTFVLARSFREAAFRAGGQPSEKDVGAAARNYAIRGYSQHVHRDIKKLIPKKKPLSCFKADNIQRGIEDIFAAYKDKLLDGVDLPLQFDEGKGGSADRDDTSTDGDSSILSDYKEAAAALARLEAAAKTPTAELDAGDLLIELSAEGAVSELPGISSTKNRVELEGSVSFKEM